MHTGSHGASPPKLPLVSIVTCSLDWLSVSVCVNVRVCELLGPAPQLGPTALPSDDSPYPSLI